MGEFEQLPNEHQLWVNLSSAGEGNIFGQIPELIRSMLAPETLDDDAPEDEFHFMLASDYDWRINIYMKLLRKMRQEEAEMPVPWREEEDVVKMHHWNIVPKSTKPQICCPEADRLSKKETVSLGPNPITWTVGDIAKAARLLTTPPMKTTFEDEQEMRRVYTLIYDTFRYKGILNQALNDIAFYQLYPACVDLMTRVWLLFFDLYHRSFRKREPNALEEAVKLFHESGLTDIESALWLQRIKLAASVARLRIKNSALRLSELLPKHLRDERVSCQGPNCPVTCWINPNRVKNEEEILNSLEKTLKVKLVDKSNPLVVDCFKWDTLCPNFVTFHHSMRPALAQSTLVQKHKLIVQDRSFCLGPATFGKIVFDMELAGNVVQSHVNSPRTTAYLATLLSLNSKITNLLAFGAGPRKGEYDTYFHDLGMTNVAIYSEKLIDMPPDANCLDRVIAVFATPPNSYSAVADPIDLVCSRGGDLSMLEVLTESEISEAGRERVTAILEEQRKTLKFAMSRPQIQLVLYETHSELEVENDGMVQKALREMNKLAKLKHAALQGKLGIQSQSDILAQEIKEINNNENIKLGMINSEESISRSLSKRQSVVSKASVEIIEPFDKIYRDIAVPNCDLFDNPTLPNLCANTDCCLRLAEEGCYLALLQRKEVTKLDNKYMIQMAEVRGLFGNTSSASGRTKTGRGSKAKKQEKRPASPPATKTKRKTKHIEFDRIGAPTQASMRHSHHSTHNNEELRNCPKNRNEEEGPLTKALHSLKSAAKDVREMTRQWEEYKKVNLGDIRKLNALTKGFSYVPDEPSSSTLKETPSVSGPSSISDKPSILDLPSISEPSSSVERLSTLSFKNVDPLKMLEKLTRSTDLKGIISSRPPYKSAKEHFPAYGWRFFYERSIITVPTDEPIDALISPASIKSSRSLATARSSKSRTRHLSPEQVLQRVATPTFNSYTRTSIQLKKVNESYITPEHQCEKCKSRGKE